MSNLTIKDKIKEVTEDFDAWCLCGSRECQRSVNYQQALKAIESAITNASVSVFDDGDNKCYVANRDIRWLDKWGSASVAISCVKK